MTERVRRPSKRHGTVLEAADFKTRALAVMRAAQALAAFCAYCARTSV